MKRQWVPLTLLGALAAAGAVAAAWWRHPVPAGGLAAAAAGLWFWAAVRCTRSQDAIPPLEQDCRRSLGMAAGHPESITARSPRRQRKQLERLAKRLWEHDEYVLIVDEFRQERQRREERP